MSLESFQVLPSLFVYYLDEGLSISNYFIK